MRNDINKLTKKKPEKKKFKLFGHVTDRALYCSKIVTNYSHHLQNE